MREKLIQLMEDAKVKALTTIGSLNKGWGAWYADYLLENGVVVLPCKIGTTVYKVVPKCNGNRCPFNGYPEMYERCRKNLCGAHIEEVPFELGLLESVNVTIFVNKSEADVALEGGKR